MEDPSLAQDSDAPLGSAQDGLDVSRADARSFYFFSNP
jgi:hypothetical protein